MVIGNEKQHNKPVICAIVAVGPDNVIGLNGTMPWHSRQDFYHFRKMTSEYPVIFGKNTFFNLPKYPLPKRLNIVCSSAYKNETVGDFIQANSLEDAIKFCSGFEKLFICGGVGLYKYALEHDYIDELYLTKLFIPDLEDKISKNSGEYVRFPVNIPGVFNAPKWYSEPFFYPNNTLPKENDNIHALFFKYTRVR